MNDQYLFLYQMLIVITLIMLGTFIAKINIIGIVGMAAISYYCYFKFMQGINERINKNICPTPK